MSSTSVQHLLQGTSVSHWVSRRLFCCCKPCAWWLDVVAGSSAGCLWPVKWNGTSSSTLRVCGPTGGPMSISWLTLVAGCCSATSSLGLCPWPRWSPICCSPVSTSHVSGALRSGSLTPPRTTEAYRVCLHSLEPHGWYGGVVTPTRGRGQSSGSYIRHVRPKYIL